MSQHRHLHGNACKTAACGDGFIQPRAVRRRQPGQQRRVHRDLQDRRVRRRVRPAGQRRDVRRRQPDPERRLRARLRQRVQAGQRPAVVLQPGRLRPGVQRRVRHLRQGPRRQPDDVDPGPGHRARVPEPRDRVRDPRGQHEQLDVRVPRGLRRQPHGQTFLGPLLCSTFSGCPANHLTNMDQLGVACNSPQASRPRRSARASDAVEVRRIASAAAGPRRCRRGHGLR
jgi:hypothetical protein